MRVLIIVPQPYGAPWNDGVKNLARALARYLEGCGDEVCVASHSRPSRGDKNHAITGRSGAITRLSSKIVLLWNVLSAKKEFRPDVTLMFASCNSLLGLKTLIVRYLLGKSPLTYVSGLRPPTLGFNLFLVADRVLVGSPFLLRYFPAARVVFPFAPVNLRPDAELLAPARQSSFNGVARKFLFLGTWETGRGLGDLLKATAIARATLPVKLILALNGYGTNDRHALIQLIGQLGLEGAVDLRETVDISKVYQEADVLVIPRSKPFRMAFPVRIVESLIMRKPLIVTKVCDMDKLIQGCGVAVEPGRPEELAEAMLELATSKKFYQECQENCAIRAADYDSRGSMERLRKELIEAFN